MQHIKTWKTETVIDGLVKPVLVTIEVENEDVDYSHWNDKAKGECEAAITMGVTECLWVSVTATFVDLEHYTGVDSLGQVFVRASEKDRLTDILQTVEINKMSRNAIADLVASVLQGKDRLDQFLNKGA